MEDYRLIEIEEVEDDEEEEEYDEGEYEEDLIPEAIILPVDLNFIFGAGSVEDEDDDYDDDDYDDDDDDDDEEEDEDEEDYEEEEELIPVARRSIEDDDYEDEDDDYEDEDEDYDFEDEDEDYDYEDEDYEDEEVDELIPVETMPGRVSSLIFHDTPLPSAVAINNGLLENSNDSETCEGKPVNNDYCGGENDGSFCPICFEAWTSSGDHQICCLPCGHIYGLSCIKKWLQQRRSSGKCPHCNNVCSLKDVRVLYASRLCVADEELHKRVRSLEANCAYLEQKVQHQLDEHIRQWNEERAKDREEEHEWRRQWIEQNEKRREDEQRQMQTNLHMWHMSTSGDLKKYMEDQISELQRRLSQTFPQSTSSS